jgi:hypothetical protein
LPRQLCHCLTGSVSLGNTPALAGVERSRPAEPGALAPAPLDPAMPPMIVITNRPTSVVVSPARASCRWRWAELFRGLVNPARHPTVKQEAGQRFIDWLISSEGQAAIAGYKINGQQLFYPNANDPSA